MSAFADKVKPRFLSKAGHFHKQKKTMPKTESILISVSVVVAAPVSENLPDDDTFDAVQDEFIDAVSERLGASAPALKGEPWFEEYQGVTFHYLSAEGHHAEKNAGRCASCGRWMSDYDAPDFLDLLRIGKTIEGKLLCDECIPDGLYEVGKRYLNPVRDDTEEANSKDAAPLDLVLALQVMQQIMLRTRQLANNGIAGRDLDAIFDYTDNMYHIALKEKSPDGNFRSVLEEAAKRYPAVFGGLAAGENVPLAERFGWQEARAHQDGDSGSIADEVIRQRGE